MRGAVLLVLLLVFAAVASAAKDPSIPQQIAKFAVDNWQGIALLALVISAILVGMGYAVGIGFEMPDMQAWAGNELAQIFANAVLVLALIGTISFLDTLVLAMVNEADIGGIHCYAGENCLKKTVNFYIDDYIDAGAEGAKSVLNSNMEATAWANRRIGINCNSLYCIQLGVTTTLVGHYVLDADRYTQIFEYYTGILSSLEAQKFFVNEIGFTVGPLILSIGIIMRAFSFTRKTGGLLVAIAAGVMFVYPMMYVFDWMTLDMALAGDKGIQSSYDWCPSECKISPPIAYYTYKKDGTIVKLNSSKGLYYDVTDTTKKVEIGFGESSQAKARAIILGKTRLSTGKWQPVKFEDDDFENRIYSCQYIDPNGPQGNKKDDGTSQAVECPRACRELPYPHGSPECANHTIAKACNSWAEPCKIARVKPDNEIDKNEYNACPKECKVIPPMKSSCNNLCVESRYDCRVTKMDDTAWRPQLNKDANQKAKDYCDKAKYCTSGTGLSSGSQSVGDMLGGLTITGGSSESEGIKGGSSSSGAASQKKTSIYGPASTSCVWIMPQFGMCEELCAGCKPECRILDENGKVPQALPSYCFSGVGSLGLKLVSGTGESIASSACLKCPSTCKVRTNVIENAGMEKQTGPAQSKTKKKAPAVGTECTSCPVVKRIMAPMLPEEYITGDCSLDAIVCPEKYRVKIPTSACDSCMYTEEAYMYNPPVNLNCGELCKPADKAPSKAAGDYTKISSDGLVGREDIKAVSKLMLPGYLLPIFNITVTLIFIKGFSGMIGGDIEIPGMPRLF